MKISDRAQRIKQSPTMAIADLANELREQGQDVIGLASGEPDFATPKHICTAAINAINAGHTKYTPVDGTSELKKAIQAKFANENNLSYETSQILVSCGAKHSLSNLMQATLNKDDEVIIPTPYWVSYPDMTLLVGAKPVIIDTASSNNYKITAQQLEQAITPKTKMFVINSPSNPSGQIYSEDELKELGAVLVKHPQIIIATDDIYEHIIWEPNKFCNIVQACPSLYEQTVVINGVSKAYAMTGWRIGYAAGEASLIKAMKKIQSQNTSNPTSISQYAAVVALTAGNDCIKEMVVAFQQRHQLINSGLNAMAGITCLPSMGTFYAFADVSVLMKKLGMATDVEFASYLLKEAQVAVVPGSAFGMEKHIRISYATSTDILEQVLDRLQTLLAT